MILSTDIGKRGAKDKTTLSVNVADDILSTMTAQEKEAAVLSFVARQARLTAVNRYRTQDGSIEKNRKAFKAAVSAALKKGMPAELAEEFARELLTSMDESFTLDPTTDFTVGYDSIVSPLWKRVEGSEEKTLVNPFEDGENEDEEAGE